MTITSPPREKLLQISQRLPASPQILLQLGQLLTDINSSLDDVAFLLRRDTALAARIIRIANSAAFGAVGGISTVEEAVNRVGFAEVYRLTGFAAAVEMAEQNLSFYGIAGTQLRDNTLIMALGMENLARLSGDSARIAYTVGLMRSTGRIVLDRYARFALPAEEGYSQSGLPNVVAWEQGLFGLTNAEVGGLVMASWHFPADVVEPVKLQYSSGLGVGVHARMVGLLSIAGKIAADAGFGLPGESICWEINSSKLRSLALTEESLAEAAGETKQAFELIRDSL